MKSKLPDIEYWRAVIEAADLGVWDYDLESGEKTYSDKWHEIRSLDRDQPLAPSDEAWLNTLHPDDVETARRFTDMINAGTAKTVAFEYREKNLLGGWTWFMCRGRAVQFDQFGRAIRFVGIDTDVTAMKALEADRVAAAQQLEMAVGVAEIGIWNFTIATQTVSWDRRLRAIYGVPNDLDPLPRDIWEQFVHHDDSRRVVAETVAGQATKQPYNLEYRIVRKGGEVRHIRSRVAFSPNGINGPCFIGVNWDVTDDVRKTDDLVAATQIAQERLAQLLVAQKELEYLTGHDPLTGIMNRRAFEAHIAELERAGKASTNLGAMVIDVDNLKAINDRWGHDVGDTVLKCVANVLKAELGGIGMVARLGGDEFVAILSKADSPQVLAERADAVRMKLCKPSFEGGPPPSVSIGVASSFAQPQSVHYLIRLADKALYEAKSSGRARVAFAQGKMSLDSGLLDGSL